MFPLNFSAHADNRLPAFWSSHAPPAIAPILQQWLPAGTSVCTFISGMPHVLPPSDYYTAYALMAKSMTGPSAVACAHARNASIGCKTHQAATGNAVVQAVSQCASACWLLPAALQSTRPVCMHAAVLTAARKLLSIHAVITVAVSCTAVCAAAATMRRARVRHARRAHSRNLLITPSIAATETCQASHLRRCGALAAQRVGDVGE